MNFLKLHESKIYEYYKNYIKYVNNCYLSSETDVEYLANFLVAETKLVKFAKIVEKLNKTYANYLQNALNLRNKYQTYDEAIQDKKFSKLVFDTQTLKDKLDYFEYFLKYFVFHYNYLLEDFPDKVSRKIDFHKKSVRIHPQTVVEMFGELKERKVEITEKEYLTYLRAKTDLRNGSMLVLTLEDANSLKLLNSYLENKYNFVIWELNNYKNITFYNGKGADVFDETTKTL